MRRIYAALGFAAEGKDEGLTLTVPTFRGDVEGRADLVEELARVKGYDAIPTTLPSGEIPDALPEPYRYWEGVARERLVAAGLQEVITYSLVDREMAARVTVESGPDAATVPLEMIGLANPMTPEQAFLRTTLLGSLIRTIASNMRHETRAYIFELAQGLPAAAEPAAHRAADSGNRLHRPTRARGVERSPGAGRLLRPEGRRGVAPGGDGD